MSDEPERTSDEVIGRRIGLGCLGLVGALLAVVAVGFALGPSDDVDRDEYDDPALQRVDAERYCQAEVKARLKSPTSALFEVSTTGSASPYTVAGTVTSDNALGAALTRDFSCTVTLVEGSWRLDELTGMS